MLLPQSKPFNQCAIKSVGLVASARQSGFGQRSAALGVDFNPLAVRRWREVGLNAEFDDATDSEFITSLPIRSADWIVLTIPIHPTGLSYEDVQTTLLQITRTAGYQGRIAVTLHSARDTVRLVRHSDAAVL